jgi:hypothetical protein
MMLAACRVNLVNISSIVTQNKKASLIALHVAPALSGSSLLWRLSHAVIAPQDKLTLMKIHRPRVQHARPASTRK